MRIRTRLLALSVVAIGGGTLATPREAFATYSPPPPPLYCCCEFDNGRCLNKCCSMFGCSATGNGCITQVGTN